LCAFAVLLLTSSQLLKRLLDKLAASSSSSSSSVGMLVAAALHLQAVMYSAIDFVAQQDRCHEHARMFIAAAPALLQQVQRAVALLPGTPAPGDSSSGSSSSAGSVAAVVVSTVLSFVVALQQALLQLLYTMRYADSAHTGVQDSSSAALLASDSLAEAAMQLLCAYTCLMYDQHTAAAAAAAGAHERQQQPLGGDLRHGLRPEGDTVACSAYAAVFGSGSGSSSSSRSSNACSASFKRPVQIGLLPINPVHERLQLLPAAVRQVCVQQVQKAAKDKGMDCLLTHVHATLHVLSQGCSVR
jgi:hypothetical protein